MPGEVSEPSIRGIDSKEIELEQLADGELPPCPGYNGPSVGDPRAPPEWEKR
jgi:hypothetical protein